MSLEAGHFVIRASDGTNLSVARYGNGPPCLFIHGGPGYAAFSFERIVGPRLGARLELISVDQRGCGRSQWSTDYRIERLVQDYEDIRLAFGLSNWSLLAHSWGGIPAINYLMNCPRSIKSLVLVNCTLNIRESLLAQIEEAEAILGIKVPGGLLNQRYFDAIGRLMNAQKFYLLQFSSEANSKLLSQLDSELPSKGSDPRFVINAFTDISYLRDYKTVAHELETPVKIIYGTSDAAVGLNHHQGFRFKNASISAIEVKHHP